MTFLQSPLNFAAHTRKLFSFVIFATLSLYVVTLVTISWHPYSTDQHAVAGLEVSLTSDSLLFVDMQGAVEALLWAQDIIRLF